MDLTPHIHMHGDQSNILVANEHDAIQDALDISMAKGIAEALNAAYPGHLWAVNVRGDQGIVTMVPNPNFFGPKPKLEKVVITTVSDPITARAPLVLPSTSRALSAASRMISSPSGTPSRSVSSAPDGSTAKS